MSKNERTAISPTRKENFPEWYQEVIKNSELAENSPVRGCMVVKPWGYGVWEKIQAVLDQMIKDTGHDNAYFPLFIPLSFLEKEAAHVEGFAKECAVVTHHRLEQNSEGKLIPTGKLEEPLVVRPTSETIIGASFSKWVESYRDLPLLINQWANVVRWEMRPRLFLRTAEFLWQEGHTVHATKKEAVEETEKMLNVYVDLARNYLALPVIPGVKTDSEKFPGADTTYCIESMMQDGKALQAGTSHFLGQNFSKASEIRFRDEDGELTYGWTTSWGCTTRLIGAIIMTHSDDNGLALPPKIAPKHIVILPVLHKKETEKEVLHYALSLKEALEKQSFSGGPVHVTIDKRDLRGGEKMWSWIKKGIPITVEVGPRDMKNDSVFVGQRNKTIKERYSISRNTLIDTIGDILDAMQDDYLEKAERFHTEKSERIDTRDAFFDFFKKDDCGFAYAHWSEDPETEALLKKELNVTVRCYPNEHKEESGHCPFTGKPSKRRAIFAKAY
jgi:prolyl-tRNA synthetase